MRSGTVKTYTIDRDGREHVLGFHFPGEVIGLDGPQPDRSFVWIPSIKAVVGGVVVWGGAAWRNSSRQKAAGRRIR